MTAAAAASPSRVLRIADGWFRAWGSVCLIALALTSVLLLVHAEAWRAAFVLSHLCALVALVPLGLVLVGRTYLRYTRERASLLDAARATLSHDRVVTTFVLVGLMTVAVSLSQFRGDQIVRGVANVMTVGVIAILVWRYLRAARSAR